MNIGQMGFLGNPRNHKVTLADATTELTFAPAGGFRGIILHSRGNFAFRLAFQTGGVDEAGGETYMLITSGNYVMFNSDESGAKVILQSENVGGDVIEIITFHSMVGLSGGVTWP